METPDDLKSNAEVQQLKAEISDTQAELHQTVAEIQDRLSPAHLKHQAADAVREAATTARAATLGRVQHMVRGQNPIPFALIGIGAAWLLAGHRPRRRSSGSDYAEYDSSWGTSTSYLSSDDDLASGYASAASSGVAADSGAATWRGDTRDRVAHVGSEVRARARQAATQARSRWGSMLHDNPMALGIAALAAGAVVGAALPRTEMENEYMGETRDQLMDSAKEQILTATREAEPRRY